MKMRTLLTEMASVVKPGIKSLYDAIHNIEESDVVYLHNDQTKMSIGTYKELKPYSAQVTEEGKFKVSFTAPERTHVIFGNNIKERFVDRKSFEKYGGIIYIFEPMTDKIAAEIMKKVGI